MKFTSHFSRNANMSQTNASSCCPMSSLGLEIGQPPLVNALIGSTLVACVGWQAAEARKRETHRWSYITSVRPSYLWVPRCLYRVTPTTMAQPRGKNQCLRLLRLLGIMRSRRVREFNFKDEWVFRIVSRRANAWLFFYFNQSCVNRWSGPPR